MDLFRVWPVLAAYLIGSLVAGIVVSRLKGSDIRERDFAGASGAVRQFGVRVGLLVFALDFAKGGLAAGLALRLAPDLAWLAGAAVVAGHCWPLFFGFRGGQGLAPAMGAVLALAWPVFVAGLSVALALIGLHRALGLKKLVRLGAVPFGAAGALLAALVVAPGLPDPAVPRGLALVALVLGARGLQVLLGRRQAPRARGS